MSTIKDKKEISFSLEIGSNCPKSWNENEINELKNQAKELARKRSSEQKLKNKLMAIQFEIEEYLNNTSPSKHLTIEEVVMDYLDVLDLSFRKFAIYLDTTDGNLKKYLSGERKFNTDLAMKFAAFFHTSPELWLYLQLKNELNQLRKEKKQIRQYQKYDYLIHILKLQQSNSLK